MTFWIIHQLRKLLKAIHSGNTPKQVAGAAFIGSWAGILPFNVILTLVILSLLYFINVNIAVGVLFFICIGLTAFIIDPLAHSIGLYLLTEVSFLQPIWLFLDQTPIVPYTRFNNTVMLGSLVMGLFISIIIYLIMLKLVILYRTKLYQWVEKTKAYKVLKASRLITFITGMYRK